MIWTKQDDGSGPAWISGIYKVEQYDASLQDRLGVHYRAYYKPTGWKHWGNYVDAGTPHYRTLKAAQVACATHLKGQHEQVTSR